MTIFHHSHHWLPFEDGDIDAGFPDPVGDRRQLKAEIGRLRREIIGRDAEIMRLTAERDRLAEQMGKRRWLRRM